MNLKDLYIKYFIERGHKQIPSAPVVPENDPSVLFNTALKVHRFLLLFQSLPNLQDRET